MTGHPPCAFSGREFAADTFPIVRTAFVFAEADQPTLEGWLADLAATPDGLAALFEVVSGIKLVRRRYADLVNILEATGARLDATLVAAGIVKAA